MPGWVQAVIGVAAFLAACGVIVKAPPVRFVLARLVVGPATEAIEAVMEPHLDGLRRQLAEHGEILATIRDEVQTNGGRSLKDRVEQVHQAVVADAEIGRLRDEGRIE